MTLEDPKYIAEMLLRLEAEATARDVGVACPVRKRRVPASDVTKRAIETIEALAEQKRKLLQSAAR